VATLLDAISEVIAKDEDVNGPVVVTGFVVLAEFMGESGEGHIYCDTLDGQRCHNTLGLLAYGTAVETQRAAQHVLGDDD
jgi:hypothetical protein